MTMANPVHHARTDTMHKSEHHTVPTTAVLLHLLKTLEARLVERALVAAPRAAGSPLWFIAETERNVYLWRRGLSLKDASLFEVWIDIPTLLAKRLRQLRAETREPNPFTTGLWGAEAEGIRDEEEYLLSFESAVTPLIAHAHALSKVGEALSREHSRNESLTTIVLPIARPSTAK